MRFCCQSSFSYGGSAFSSYNSDVHKFVRDLITEWRRLGLPVSNETLVIGVSGGADSLSLLLAIDDLRTRKKLDCRIVAAHFNHKLRGAASDADEEFVKQIVSDRGLELAIGHGEIGKKGNLEQNARHARYEFLVQTAKNLGSGHILTAHTVNDQAETFLLNLIRGSGIDGLSGMKPVREIRQETGDERQETRELDNMLPFDSTRDSSLPFPVSRLLVRPLLRWAKRKDTENFCRESGVEFRYDTMNEDMSFKRVRVRKMLLPMLAEFNPKIVETLARTANLLSEPGAVATGFRDDSSDDLSIRELKLLESGDLHQTLRTWLKTRRGGLRSITLKHIEAVESLIQSQKSGRTVELPGFGLVRKRDGRLSFENIKVDK